MSGIEEFIKYANERISKRDLINLKAIYAELGDQYPSLVLTHTYALEHGAEEFGEDIEILCGQSLAGKFYLYDHVLDIIFEVDKPDGTYTHWHPGDTAEATEDVKLFMQGICKY